MNANEKKVQRRSHLWETKCITQRLRNTIAMKADPKLPGYGISKLDTP